MAADTFFIDKQAVAFKPGETIIQAAARADIYIPHLCYHPEFAPHGSCKVCTVKVDGRITGACYQPIVAGMQVENDTVEMNMYRRRLVQMLFTEGNHYCPFCERSGNCQLQAVAYHLDMEDMHYPMQQPVRQVDASHPEVMLDYDRCILCELCVRASRDADHKNVFGIAGRGIHTRLVVNSESGLLRDTTLSADDKAAHVCPVGAILIKRQGFTTPIGQRLYDKRDISEVGNRQPEEAAVVKPRR